MMQTSRNTRLASIWQKNTSGTLCSIQRLQTAKQQLLWTTATKQWNSKSSHLDHILLPYLAIIERLTFRAIIWLNSTSIALQTSPYDPDPTCACNLYLSPTGCQWGQVRIHLSCMLITKSSSFTIIQTPAQGCEISNVSILQLLTKEGNHLLKESKYSLERHTNLAVCSPEHVKAINTTSKSAVVTVWLSVTTAPPSHGSDKLLSLPTGISSRQ